MEWKVLKNKNFILVYGKKYPLEHLKDFILNLEIDADSNNPALVFKLMIQFSSHCVSVGPKKGSPFIFNSENLCTRIIDERGIARKFCENRYKLSLKLAGIFHTILKRHCFFTGRDNWMTIEMVSDNGQPFDYEVFFRIYRESGKYLRLFVESAYIRSTEALAQKPSGFKKSGKIKAKTLLAKKLRKENISEPR